MVLQMAIGDRRETGRRFASIPGNTSDLFTTPEKAARVGAEVPLRYDPTDRQTFAIDFHRDGLWRPVRGRALDVPPRTGQLIAGAPNRLLKALFFLLRKGRPNSSLNQ